MSHPGSCVSQIAAPVKDFFRSHGTMGSVGERGTPKQGRHGDMGTESAEDQ
jgi:hypothetical protein